MTTVMPSKDSRLSSSEMISMESDTMESDAIFNDESSTSTATMSPSSDASPMCNRDEQDDDEFEDEDFVQKPAKATRKRKLSSSSSYSSSSEEEVIKKKLRSYKGVKETAPKVKKAASKAKKAAYKTKGADKSEEKARKKTRKIMSDDKLQKATLKAEREEEERKKRLAARKVIFPQDRGETSHEKWGNQDEFQPLLLDVDNDSQSQIEVHESIVRKLKPHQVEGVKFMYNSLFESVDLMKKEKAPGGCILAHCMGLGKTLQTVAFVHTMMAHSSITKTKRVLIICPKNTVTNWHKEFRLWLKETPRNTQPKLFNLWDAKGPAARMQRLKEWHREGGVGIINYDMVRKLICDALNIRTPPTKRQLANPKLIKKRKPMPPSHIATVKMTLLNNPGPDMVICDEGHLMRNHESLISRALLNIGTKRRIVLTGTPLQNNLNEYHTMMQFVKPNLLGNLQEFKNRFTNPIKAGESKDSRPHEVAIMKRRAHVLYRTLAGCVQRMGFEVLTPYLPEKQEYCIVLRPTEFQKLLYTRYLQMVDVDIKSRGKRLFEDYANIIKIIAHPFMLTIPPKNKKKEEKVVVNDDDDEDDDDNFHAPAQSANNGNNLEEDAGEPLDLAALPPGGPVEWWMPIFKDIENPREISHSGKFVVLESIIRQCAYIGDRLLIFSQFLTPLNLIEEMLKEMDDIAKENGTPSDRWRFGKEYFRIDGATNITDRQSYCDAFNKTGPFNRSKLFLISTRAGGLGINLFGANRVIIFDASWNPANDMQGIFRVYRLGQTKPCYIYRLLMEGTMEEKIYNRQVVKLSLSSRVVDEHQVERHFKMDELAEFYNFNPSEENDEGPTLAVPKDEMLANLLMANKKSIVKYFEHDSLLQDKKEEQLTEEEKKQAWEEYENLGKKKRGLQLMQAKLMDPMAGLTLRERLQALNPTSSQEELDATEMLLKDQREIYRDLLDQTDEIITTGTDEEREDWELEKIDCYQTVKSHLGSYAKDFLNSAETETENLVPGAADVSFSSAASGSVSDSSMN